MGKICGENKSRGFSKVLKKIRAISLLGKAVAAGVDVVGEVAASLQLRGEAVFSTTVIRGHGKCFRACIVNHRTTREDIEVAVRAVEMALQAFHQA